MPKEVKDPEEFIRLSQNAEICRVKRLGETVKLKLRTSEHLYTYKAARDKAEDVLKKLKCKTEEI
jgi:ferritin-like protein